VEERVNAGGTHVIILIGPAAKLAIKLLGFGKVGSVEFEVHEGL
jgi:hypothetical protein